MFGGKKLEAHIHTRNTKSKKLIMYKDPQSKGKRSYYKLYNKNI